MSEGLKMTFGGLDQPVILRGGFFAAHCSSLGNGGSNAETTFASFGM